MVTLPHTIKSDKGLLLVVAIIILVVTIPLPLVLLSITSTLPSILIWLVLGSVWIALGFQLLSAAQERIVLDENAMRYHTLSGQDEIYYEHIRNVELVYQPHGKGTRTYFMEFSGIATARTPLRIAIHNFSSNDLSVLIDVISTHSPSVTMSKLLKQITINGLPLAVRMGQTINSGAIKTRDS